LSSLPSTWIEKIFLVLHGRFGNSFIDKFKNGQTNQNGQDCGVENAKIVWASQLSGMQPEALKIGLNATYTYPPSCDDFKTACLTKKQSLHPSHLPMLPSPTVPVDEEALNRFNQVIKKSSEEFTRREFKDGRYHWAKILKKRDLGERFLPITIKYAEEAMANMGLDYKEV
jgi:hypothetical protein